MPYHGPGSACPSPPSASCCLSVCVGSSTMPCVWLDTTSNPSTPLAPGLMSPLPWVSVHTLTVRWQLSSCQPQSLQWCSEEAGVGITGFAQQRWIWRVVEDRNWTSASVSHRATLILYLSLKVSNWSSFRWCFSLKINNTEAMRDKIVCAYLYRVVRA